MPDQEVQVKDEVLIHVGAWQGEWGVVKRIIPGNEVQYVVEVQGDAQMYMRDQFRTRAEANGGTQ